MYIHTERNSVVCRALTSRISDGRRWAWEPHDANKFLIIGLVKVRRPPFSIAFCVCLDEPLRLLSRYQTTGAGTWRHVKSTFKQVSLLFSELHKEGHRTTDHRLFLYGIPMLQHYALSSYALTCALLMFRYIEVSGKRSSTPCAILSLSLYSLSLSLYLYIYIYI